MDADHPEYGGLIPRRLTFCAKEEVSDAFAALESRKDELQAACGCALDLSEPLKIDARLKADCEDESDWPRQVEWFRTTFPLFAAKVVQILEQGSLIPEAPPAA